MVDGESESESESGLRYAICESFKYSKVKKWRLVGNTKIRIRGCTCDDIEMNTSRQLRLL